MNDATAILKAAANWAQEAITAYVAEHPEEAAQLGAGLASGQVLFELRIADLIGAHPVVSLVAIAGDHETSVAHQRLDRADAGGIN